MFSIDLTPLFTRPDRNIIFGLRISAIIESIIALAALLLYDAAFGDHTRYWSFNPHPFWFVVLFAAGKYGTKEGLVAMALCSLALLVGNLPEQSINQDEYTYLFFVIKLPLLWLVSAVLFGELRQVHIRERDRLENAVLESEEREQRIAGSYQQVKALKDRLELRMAGQLRSGVAAYHAAKMMESLSPDEVLKGLEELVSATLNSAQFSIYMLGRNGLEISLTHEWPANDSHLRHFGSESVLYHAVIVQQKILCIADAKQQRLLGNEGILAGPLLDRKDGQVVGMLKIEKMNFSDLHLSNIEAFGAICEWAGMAIVNAHKYQASREGSMINPEHNLFTHHYFKHYMQHMSALAKRVGFDMTMLSIKLVNPGQIENDERARVGKLLSTVVQSALRHIDLAFEQHENSEEYVILLPATNRAGAVTVVEKIRDTLKTQMTGGMAKADFAFSIQAIYEKPSS